MTELHFDPESKMRICKLAIKNWRSIKDLEISPKDITALIGPNNAGKTNILSALNFLLGERWPSANQLQDADFYMKDRSQEIYISVWFLDAPENISRVWFSTSDGRLYYSYTGNDKAYSMNAKKREGFAVVYLDASRSYEGSFSTSQWSLFGKIIRELDRNFKENNTEEVRLEVQRLLSDAHDLLKTDLYKEFELNISRAFTDQIRQTSHQVRFDFKTFDPLNFYKNLHPILIEQEITKSPNEVGSGMRNLIVLALFRAYAAIMKDGAIVAIEEPEIYLHPHAQRSLANLFEEMAASGGQVFYSTHSPNFVSVERPDRLVLVERCEDDEEHICTQVHYTDADELYQLRSQLHPGKPMSIASVRERFRMVCEPIHADAFFARVVVIVEGPTEAAALPIYAEHLGLDINGLGISIVPARGKTNIDLLYHLYRSIGLHVYIIFDNDSNKKSTDSDRQWNAVLTRMLCAKEELAPNSCVAANYAIFDVDYEHTVKKNLDLSHPELYDRAYQDAIQNVGSSKPLIARYMATKLVEANVVPEFICDILKAVALLAELREDPMLFEELPFK
ncbi:ATP-dependent nuclease [Methylobacterium brachiatum]